MVKDLLDELRRHNLLQSLVERQIIAEAVGTVHIPTEAVDKAHTDFLQSRNLNDEDSLKEFLHKHGLKKDHLDWQIPLHLRIQSYSQSHFSHKAEAHFLKRKNELDKVTYSLIRTKDKSLARELFLRIEAEEADFADLAAGYSEGPERNTKGIVGPVSMTSAHPLLAERLRTSKPGNLMHPVQISDWWLVARLESLTPAIFDSAMASRMSQELFNQWVSEEAARKIVTSYSFDVGTIDE